MSAWLVDVHMSTEELKAKIQRNIGSIDDRGFLEMIESLVAGHNSPEPTLAEWQGDRMKEGLRQYEQGKGLSQEDLDRKSDEWLDQNT